MELAEFNTEIGGRARKILKFTANFRLCSDADLVEVPVSLHKLLIELALSRPSTTRLGHPPKRQDPPKEPPSSTPTTPVKEPRPNNGSQQPDTPDTTQGDPFPRFENPKPRPKRLGHGGPMSTAQIAFIRTILNVEEGIVYGRFKQMFHQSRQTPERVLEVWHKLKYSDPKPPKLQVEPGALVRIRGAGMREIGLVKQVSHIEGRALVKFPRSSQSLSVDELEAVDPAEFEKEMRTLQNVVEV